jgi:hypothetical protein
MMAWESGKSQIIKFIVLLIFIMCVIILMMASFFIIPYKDVETYLIMNIAVDLILIILMILVVNLRVWKYLSGATFYALEIYKPDGEAEAKLFRRYSYFEVDIDKIESQMDSNQVKILHENERAIRDLKDAVAAMTKKRNELEEETRKEVKESAKDSAAAKEKSHAEVERTEEREVKPSE